MLYLQHFSDSGAQYTPDSDKHVAEVWKTQANYMKQTRLQKEETAHHEKAVRNRKVGENDKDGSKKDE